MRFVSLVLATVVACGSVALGAQAPATPPPPPKPKPAPAAPAVLIGNVVGPDTKPVADALVLVTPASDPGDPALVARTDAAGAFRVTLRRRGPHTVRVERPGLAAQTLEKIAAGGAPLRITLAAGGTIEGTVHDAASGAPVAGARIEAR